MFEMGNGWMAMDKFHNPRTAALLAVLPHVDFKYKKEVAVAIKMMEMRDILRHYDNISAQKVSNNWRQEFLTAITPHMSEANQKTLQSMMQVMQMQEIMGGMGNG